MRKFSPRVASFSGSGQHPDTLVHTELIQKFLRDPTASEGVPLLYTCKKNHDFLGAALIFRALETHKKVSADAVVAFMRASRDCGHYQEILTTYNSLSQLGVTQNTDIAINTLVACGSVASPASLQIGKQIHLLYQSNVEPVGQYLVGMYAKCGQHQIAIDLWRKLAESLAPAYLTPVICTTVLTSCAQLATSHALSQGTHIHSLVRSNMVKPDSHLYTTLMNMYTKCKHPQRALEVWSELESSKQRITSHITCVGVLTACARVGTPVALEIGKRAHLLATAAKWTQPTVFSALVTMYTKCGSPETALHIWKQHLGQTAATVELYTSMLSTCATIGPAALHDGVQIHSRVMDSHTMQPDIQFFAALVNMYSKCGQPANALSVWKNMQGNYVGLYDDRGIALVVTVLGACATSRTENALAIGAAIHSRVDTQAAARINKTSLMVYYTALITMYNKCDSPDQAVAVYTEMLQRRIHPGPVTYLCLLTACAALGPRGLSTGKRIYSAICNDGIIIDTSLENSLLSMFSKCGEPLAALERWKKICASQSTVDTVTKICALAACADIGASAISNGRQIHSITTGEEVQREDVLAALINMYARCGEPLKSLQLWRSFTTNSKGPKIPVSPALYTAIFTTCATLRTPEALQVGSAARIMMGQSLIQNNAITITAMMQMYSRCGDAGTALTLWKDMMTHNVPPTPITYLCVLCAFTSLGMPADESICSAVEQIIQHNRDAVELAVAMLDNYSSSGRLPQAERLFGHLQQAQSAGSVYFWNVMIKAYGVNLMADKAISIFRRMISVGVQPTRVTFTSLLSACAHSGRTLEAQHFFELLVDYGITPSFEHICCIIDGFSRHGQMQEAQDFITQQKNQNIIMWRTLLGGIRSKVMQLRKQNSEESVAKEVARAEFAVEKIKNFDPKCGATYVTLGNIYASAGLHDKASVLRTTMIKNGISKIPGISWLIDQDGVCHKFYANDTFHPQIAQVNAKWEELAKLVNYVPDLDWVLHNESDEKKHIRLCKHSEKLALCYGLISLPTDATIYISKNLRMCGDCHAATALISRVLQRTIVVRDAKIFHMFEDGKCRCNNQY
eukprot:Phypoly_transcript_01284.p1 GENE.Phypoly_transcript_01284~~Phypoly_transcript_01284.p1  ORF type:complete len:1084 (+),score=72.14 Phypoly_transcript_01284:226-3477(+)